MLFDKSAPRLPEMAPTPQINNKSPKIRTCDLLTIQLCQVTEINNIYIKMNLILIMKVKEGGENKGGARVMLAE